MKNIFSFALTLLFFFNVFIYDIQASDNKETESTSKIIIANKYAERVCSAKSDNFFEGLDNEQDLKYSYFRYIGLQSDEILSNGLDKLILDKIKDKCQITIKEEKEINEFLSINLKPGER